MIDRFHKLSRFVSTQKAVSPSTSIGPEVFFVTTAITIWWPLDRIQGGTSALASMGNMDPFPDAKLNKQSTNLKTDGLKPFILPCYILGILSCIFRVSL